MCEYVWVWVGGCGSVGLMCAWKGDRVGYRICGWVNMCEDGYEDVWVMLWVAKESRVGMCIWKGC